MPTWPGSCPPGRPYRPGAIGKPSASALTRKRRGATTDRNVLNADRCSPVMRATAQRQERLLAPASRGQGRGRAQNQVAVLGAHTPASAKASWGRTPPPGVAALRKPLREQQARGP